MSVTNEQAVALAEKDAEIARQWIDYLKKKNTNATALWVVFLVWALVATGFAFLHYTKQLELSAQVQVQQQTSTAENHALLAQLGQQKQRLAEQEQKLTAQAEALSKMSMSSGEAGEQLVLTTQLAETLKQKVAQLEQDNSLLEDALAKSNKAIALVEYDKNASKKALDEKKGMLDARAKAFSALVKRQKETKAEMERLSDELSKLNDERSDLAKRNATLSRELSELVAKNEAQTKQLASESLVREQLQVRLNNLTTPIDSGDKSSRMPTVIPSDSPLIKPAQVPVVDTNAVPNKALKQGAGISASNSAVRKAHDLAVQPIVPVISKPKAEQNSNANAGAKAKPDTKVRQGASSLDFDSIAIE